ncbi:MAG: Ig-like domain-containing protein, partial [Lachnospiraceae bacterium]|nr:Ig-like domain-containing protein [Lachnospiraceae bacterium]
EAYEEGEEYEDEAYEEGEEYEDEAYEEDEEYEGETYEEDEEYEDEEYEEDEEYDGGYDEEDYDDEDDEYDGDDEDYDDEDEDYDDEEYDEYDDDDSVIVRIRHFLEDMSTLDVVVAMLGVVVLAGVIVTGALYANAKSIEKQVAAFATVGEELEGISVIGESGLVAVSESARLADMIELTEEPEQEEQQHEEQEDQNKGIEVVLNLTSIQSDLKIKFVNKATGKLIGGLPFEVEVTNGKKNFDLKDEDKDGIIYQTGIDAGTYQVTVKPFAGNEHAKYKLPASASSIKVTDTIAYKKVNVSDEVKSESEINAAAEDKAVQNTVVESALTDTVEWVESTKTPIGEGTAVYEEVSKKDIPDPWTVSGAYRKLVEEGDGTEEDPANISISISSGSLSLDKGESGSLSVNVSGTSLRYMVEWSSSDTAVATVSEGSVTGVGVGSATITARVAVGSMIQELTCSVTVSEPEKPDEGDGGENPDNKDDKDKDNKDKDDKNKDDKDNQDKDVVYTKVSISGDKEVAVGKTITLSAKTEPKDGKIKWSSESEKIAKVDDKGVVTGVGEGTVKITAVCENSETEDVSATYEIKVKKAQTVDGSAKLKDKDGNQMYYKSSDGEYKEAVYDDYNKRDAFFKKSTKVSEYKYTGWQTIDGHVYFYDKNGNYVTGEQVIQGAKYTFGSDGKLSSNSGTMGIDVSKHNGSIDWNAVKNSGVSYVIIRCGYRGYSTGVLVEDPKFRSNIKGAKAAGLKVGVYVFSQAVNEVEAVEEASMAVGLASGYGLDYPIFIDVEGSGGRGDGVSRDMRTAVCKAFCATVQDSGYSAGIYANKTWFNEKISTGSLTGYKIWLAQYASAPTYTATRYDMWQYSSKGRVSGIKGNVDMNISYMHY